MRLGGSTNSRHLRVGGSRPVRMKDLVAWRLTTVKGFPEFGRIGRSLKRTRPRQKWRTFSREARGRVN